MCYSIPGRVVETMGRTAVVDYYGEHRTVVNEFEGLAPGEYVYAQGGFIVQRIPGDEAREILDVWKELFFRLKGVDEAKSGDAKPKAAAEFAKLVGKAEISGGLQVGDIAAMLSAEGPDAEYLALAANRTRKAALGNSCCVHGIIEFSNYCASDCGYCGIRDENKKPERYRMTVDEIAEAALEAVNVHGFRALVLQSGDDPGCTDDMLAEAVSKVREKCPALIIMSVGTRTRECYRRMYEAGARGALIRFETSNPKLYAQLHKGLKASLDERLRAIRDAVELGYVVATGSLIGLPGQTDLDIAGDITLAKTLKAEMHSFGPLIPHPDTPLWECPKPPLRRVLNAIAADRLNDREAKILVTTALETLDGEGRRRGLMAGANSLMINVTPAKYRMSYSIYPGHARQSDVAADIRGTLDLLYSLGRAPTDLGVKAGA